MSHNRLMALAFIAGGTLVHFYPEALGMCAIAIISNCVYDFLSRK